MYCMSGFRPLCAAWGSTRHVWSWQDSQQGVPHRQQVTWSGAARTCTGAVAALRGGRTTAGVCVWHSGHQDHPALPPLSSRPRAIHGSRRRARHLPAVTLWRAERWATCVRTVSMRTGDVLYVRGTWAPSPPVLHTSTSMYYPRTRRPAFWKSKKYIYMIDVLICISILQNRQGPHRSTPSAERFPVGGPESRRAKSCGVTRCATATLPAHVALSTHRQRVARQGPTPPPGVHLPWTAAPKHGRTAEQVLRCFQQLCA